MILNKEQKQNTINPLTVKFSQDVLSSKFYSGDDNLQLAQSRRPDIFMERDSLWLRELFSKASVQLYQIEMEKLIEFSKEHFDGVGWSQIKTLPDLGNVYDCKITLSALQSTVFSGWTDYGKFATNDALGQEFIVKDSFVLAYNDKVFVYGVATDDVIVELCVDYTFLDAQLVEVISSVLYTLGTRYYLMLADWRSKKIIDLSDKGAVVEYLDAIKAV